jgi:hypothetical protein
MKKDGSTNWADVGGKAAIMLGMAFVAGGMVAGSSTAAVVGSVLIIGGVVAVIAGGGARGSSAGGTDPSVGAGAGSSSEGAGSETGSAGGTPETGCFVAGTLVALGNGSRKAIETVEVGDLVLSQREDGGALGAQRVSHIWEHTVQRTLLLNFSDGEQLETTKEHRFHVDDGGFVPAGKLRPGAALNTPANNVVLRDAKERNATAPVYNLEVENFHTYFVGDNLVWVHNKKESEGEGTEGEGKSDNK